MQIQHLINGATSNVTGEPVKLDRHRQNMAGNLPIQIFKTAGTFAATVTIEATLSQVDIDTAVREETAAWSPVANGVFTSEAADALVVPFPYIRAVISGYSSGTISVTIDR